MFPNALCEILDWLEKRAKDDHFIPAVYWLTYNKARKIEAKYACESLKKVGY